MLSGLISAGSKVLGGARFSLISVLPGFLIITVIMVLSRAHLYSPDAAVNFSHVAPTRDEAPAAALFAFLAFLGGVLLRPFEAALVQFLEGYWAAPSLLAPLRRASVERHRRRRARAMTAIKHAAQDSVAPNPPPRPGPGIRRSLTELAAHDRAAARSNRAVARALEIRRGYPVEVRAPVETPDEDPDGELMPTLLGNALLRGERLSGDRYGLDMPTVYPRLYPFISPRLQGAVVQQMDLISAAASLCITLTVTTVATLPLIARVDGWSLLPLAPALLAYLAYRGAVAAALFHCTILATVMDLHRFDLIKAFHYAIPKTEAGISNLNRQLSRFLYEEGSRLDQHRSFDRLGMVHPADDQDVLQRANGNGSTQA